MSDCQRSVFPVETFPLELARSEADGITDDAPGLDDTDDTGHGYTADTYETGVVAENFCWRGGLDLRSSICAEQRYDDPPYECRSGKDDKGVAQADDVAETKHGSSGVAAECEFGFLRESLSPACEHGVECAGPPSECLHEVVIDTADERGHDKSLGLTLVGGTFAKRACEHLCGGCGLGEGVLAVHVLHEVFAEGYEEKYAENAAKERTEEYLYEIHRYLRILILEDVKCGESEYGSCHDYTRACTDGLDDDILAKRILLFQCARHAYGNDGDRDGGLEYLSDLEAKVSCRGTEYHCEKKSHAYGVGCDLGIIAGRMHDGPVGLIGPEFAERVFRKLYGVRILKDLVVEFTV